MLAHIAGMPIEETLTGLAPVGATALGALLVTARHHARRLRRGGRRTGP